MMNTIDRFGKNSSIFYLPPPPFFPWLLFSFLYFVIDNAFCLLFFYKYSKLMRWSESKPRLQLLKEWIFSFCFTLDTNQYTNAYAQLFSIVMELSVLHYFYINPAFTFLNNHAIFKQYLLNFRLYFIHVYAFGSPVLSLLTLSLYPQVIILAALVKKFGPNKLLVPILQVAIYLFPLLWVKILIEIVCSLSMGHYLYLSLPLAAVNLLFGALLLLLGKRTYRLMEFVLVLMLELRANEYAILTMLLVRLGILGYLLRSANRNSTGFYFQVSLMAILVASAICDDQFLNNFGFFTIVAACLVFGISQTRRALDNEQAILSYADLLEKEDEEEAIFDVYRIVEAHHVDCDLSDCLCQGFYDVQRGKLSDWVYKFEQQRLRRSQSLQGRLDYACKCWSHYDFKLSGLVRVCEGKPQGLMQQYQIFKVCSIYELNLRKQDKNYRYGQPFKNSQEELQAFHNRISSILSEIRKFWSLITRFDGSTKFLNEILLISQQIIRLREEYRLCAAKYDQELKEFKYAYELFLSIILNEEVAEQDELIVPQPSAFIVTNGQTILNANNAFLALTSHTMDSLIGHPYSFFIPDVYRDIHKEWASEFIGRVQDYEGKAIGKCLSMGTIEIKMVQMEHRVLPRFLDGLEIFTIIRSTAEIRKEKRDSFVFLAEKQTFYIKNVESSFFDAVKFKVSQRNFKLLQEMSLTSIFQNFSINPAENPNREVTIFPHFLQEFTFTKSKRKTGKNKTKVLPNTRQSNILTNTIKALVETDPVFQFAVLPSNRPEDPYIKVQFTTREEKVEEAPSSQESVSRVNEPQQNILQQKPKKEDSFGFLIPYYILAVLGICHIFYSLGRTGFDSAMSELQKRYEFYLEFDYTTLKVLQAYTGIDYTENLRVLWIGGYGDFSQSFNALRRVDDPYFRQYFDSEITVNFHNQLFFQIQASISQALSSLRFFQILSMVTLIITIGYAILDMLLTLRYTFFIEGKVGALLLQFVIVEANDVKEITSIIEAFESTVLNSQQKPIVFKVPIQVGEDSAFQLMKGGGYSLNNSMAICDNQQETPKQHNRSHSGRKRGSSIGERVSLSMMREEFKINEKSSSFKKEAATRQEFIEEKNRNINLFKRRYRSCNFIIGANKKLFGLIFLGFVITMTVLFVSFLFLYTPFDYLPLHLQTMDRLQQARIILLKSQTEILINSTSLQPPASLSSTLLSLISLVGGIASGPAMTAFSSQFSSFLNADACGMVQYNCSLLASDNGLHKFGIKVISQYLQNYFRQRNATALSGNNLQNQVIIYTEVLFNKLVQDFAGSSREYCVGADGGELRMVVLGSLGLLVGLILVHYSLREFKDRIENSRNLLQIIPKEIQKKQEKDVEELTLKELSTP